jgi:signal transduction histidine kinase
MRDHILLLEDDDDHAALITLALRPRPVRHARTADEGLRAVAEATPTLLLLDLNLPGVSGHGVLETLRAQPSTRSLPIVVLSTSDALDDRRRALLAGATDYLVKPAGLAPLREALATVCGRYDALWARLRLGAFGSTPEVAPGVLVRSWTPGSTISGLDALYVDAPAQSVPTELPVVVGPRGSVHAGTAVMGRIEQPLSAHGLTALLEVVVRSFRRERQLRRRIDELERSAAHLAHDLRGPIRQVGAYTELLARQLDAPHPLFAHLEAAARSASTVIDTTLEGFVRPKVTAVDLDAALDVALQAVAPLPPDLQVRRHPLPTVRAEPTDLARVLQNLLANAIRYRRPLPLVVEVAARVHGHRVRLGISDNGRGIAAGDLERVFEPGERGRRTDAEGSGLGLAFVRDAVHRWNGEVHLASVRGVGTTVVLDLETA